MIRLFSVLFGLLLTTSPPLRGEPRDAGKISPHGSASLPRQARHPAG